VVEFYKIVSKLQDMKNERKSKILWADDEIELLEPHILFLEQKGYKVIPVSSGESAIATTKNDDFDIILLDEMMDGIDGLETLEEIKKIDPGLPIIMITKSEEESLMEEAIGGKVSDYLTKPVNPSQILLACKKILDQKTIIRQRIGSKYLQEFNQISSRMLGPLDLDEWVQIHNILAQKQVELDMHPELGFGEMLADQIDTANREFARFITRNYRNMLRDEHIPFSPKIMPMHVQPLVENGEKVLFVLIDCMRWDQWLTIEPLLYDQFSIRKKTHISILPTATPFSRNAIFAGMFPRDIQKKFPQFYPKDNGDESSLNQFESELLAEQTKRWKSNISPKYFKPVRQPDGEKLLNNFNSIKNENLIAVVVNFVDFVAHKRSDSDILKEMVPNESSYRAMIRTWFEGSWVYKLIQESADAGFTIVITGDHGSIQVKKSVKVHADRTTSDGIRYKHGKNINTDNKHTFNIQNPEDFFLPNWGFHHNFLIAESNHFFVYPNRIHEYEKRIKNTFQHGGISTEEMIIPVAILEKKF